MEDHLTNRFDNVCSLESIEHRVQNGSLTREHVDACAKNYDYGSKGVQSVFVAADATLQGFPPYRVFKKVYDVNTSGPDFETALINKGREIDNRRVINACVQAQTDDPFKAAQLSGVFVQPVGWENDQF